MADYIEPGYKIVINDYGIKQYQITLHFDVDFEGDNGTRKTLEEDLRDVWNEITDREV